MDLGIDAREEGLALAKESGADVVIDSTQEKEKVVGEVIRLLVLTEWVRMLQ